MKKKTLNEIDGRSGARSEPVSLREKPLPKQSVVSNKSGQSNLSTWLNYVFSGFIVLTVFVFIFFGWRTFSGISAISKQKALGQDASQRLQQVQQKDIQETVNEKKQALLNAREKGQQLADAEQVFVHHFFAKDNPVAQASDYASKFEKASAVVQKYLPKEFITNPWLRNPRWHIKMETVVNFSSEDAPIIFTMWNDSNTLTGIVTCSYDGDQFKNVSVKYTEEGLKDAVDSGQ